MKCKPNDELVFQKQKCISLQSRMKLAFKVTSMECVGNKVILGSEQGGLYAFSTLNDRFKMLFALPSAHSGSYVSQLHAQESLPMTIFSCGFYERKVVSWNITTQFKKNTESKVFKTFIYQFTSTSEYVLLSTLKKIYALDPVSLAPKMKFTIQNYKSLDYLISSLGFMISMQNSSYLIAGTDNYKRQNFFLALWQLPESESSEQSQQQLVKKVRKLSNIDDLDNFDLDAECTEIETETIEVAVPKNSSPQMLEYAHSSRIFDIKCISALNRFVTLSYSELNIWAIHQNDRNCNTIHNTNDNTNNNLPGQFPHFTDGISQVYSLRFGGEVNPQMNIRVTSEDHNLLLFLDSLMVVINLKEPKSISQVPITATKNPLTTVVKPASLVPWQPGCAETSSSRVAKYAIDNHLSQHANHFTLKQQETYVQTPTQALIFVREITQKKTTKDQLRSKTAAGYSVSTTTTMSSLEETLNMNNNPRESNDFPTPGIAIYPIEEEHSEMEEEPSSGGHIPKNYQLTQQNHITLKSQNYHTAPSTAHILPSAASVTILQNQLKKLEQSKTGKSLANIPATYLPRKNSQGQLRSNSKSIKKQLKRVVKFSNRRKKKAKQNMVKDLCFLNQQQQQQQQQGSQQHPSQFKQASLSPPQSKQYKLTYQNQQQTQVQQHQSQQQNSHQRQHQQQQSKSLSPRQVAILAVQNKQLNNINKKQSYQQQSSSQQAQSIYQTLHCSNQNSAQQQQTPKTPNNNQISFQQGKNKSNNQNNSQQPTTNNHSTRQQNQKKKQSKPTKPTLNPNLPGLKLVAFDSLHALGLWKIL